jgi:MoaA/NifB/PqqE/SkfB family radical SAM enzyme
VAGIMNLKKLDQEVIMNTVITKSNYRHLPEIAKLLVSLDVDQFQLAFVHADGSAGKNFQSVVPRMSLAVPYVKKAIDIGRRFNKNVMTEAIPFCFMVGYEDSISEKVIPETKIYEHDYIVENFTDARITRGKAKGGRCKKCRYYKICEGTWKEYPQKFGWEEFKPVQSEYGKK